MSLNLNRMNKKDILWLWNHRCKHGHRYLSHYNCYLKEQNIHEIIGFLDIETSNLKADFGIVYSYAIKIAENKTIYRRVISAAELKNDTMDKLVVQSCINDLMKFDRIITHYGTKFDLPFLRTRALIHNLEFPKYGELKHTDVYYLAKRLLCIHSNRQNIIAEALLGKTIKTRLDNQYWVRGLQGNKKSLDYILDHNIKDVIELEKNYNKLIAYANKTNRSI